MRIENTEDPSSIHATGLLATAVAMGGGSTSEVIENQERRGQAQLVHSDQLPTDMQGDDQAAFEELGFVFGEPDERDPLFRPVTLPEGWAKEGADHDMWSYVVDELGRRRVAVFYKAAFYDRRAFMGLNTVARYVTDCVYRKQEVVTDATWATPAAVAEAARLRAEAAQKNADSWSTGPGANAQWQADAEAERDAYLAIAAQHTAA